MPHTLVLPSGCSFPLYMASNAGISMASIVDAVRLELPVAQTAGVEVFFDVEANSHGNLAEEDLQQTETLINCLIQGYEDFQLEDDLPDECGDRCDEELVEGDREAEPSEQRKFCKVATRSNGRKRAWPDALLTSPSSTCTAMPSALQGDEREPTVLRS